jgi:hypothetical protein
MKKKLPGARAKQPNREKPLIHTVTQQINQPMGYRLSVGFKLWRDR